MLRAASLLSSVALLAAVAVTTAAPAGADRPAPAAVASAKRVPVGTLLRLDGIDKLRLGMTRNAGYATGQLRTTAETCLDGKRPLPITYGSDGPKAAPAARYTAYFRGGRNGRLTHVTAFGGVVTELGIRPGVSTGQQLVARYKRAGYTVRSEWVANLNATVIHVLRGRRQVLDGLVSARLGRRRTPLTAVAIPRYFLCPSR
ncbi:hypothetical protein Q5424_26270 [Conexibacter sp. JD483]|uniref:hypothetical protein n=1 Tax=unclassified Conexibacter TaxID=2627773 RepID=UPI0027174863|nr:MULTISPECIES: hypothetical protein [unclassified Conexibacter]MDO8189474.1 hypothetical protein [Conexibacter sp. CPCC 205706]MDO8202064.1 hypothetical protein [Conexibacter sp. CPCC 205762]MDR9372633.1 hypothetical protein [Conexibacter sp. JD483]